jgi:hypothetical protein
VIDVDAVDSRLPPLLEAIRDLVGGADDPVGALHHPGHVTDGRLVVAGHFGRPADEALHAGELTQLADRGVQRQAAGIDPGVTEGVQRNAFQVEVSLEFVVAADRIGVGVTDHERQALRKSDVVGLPAVRGCQRPGLGGQPVRVRRAGTADVDALGVAGREELARRR